MTPMHAPRRRWKDASGAATEAALAGLLLVGVLASGWWPGFHGETPLADVVPAVDGSTTCGSSVAASYYAFDLLPTRSDSRLSRARGTATVSWNSSPFDVTLSRDGHFVYDLSVSVSGLRPADAGSVLAVWAAPPDLKGLELVGILDSEGPVSGVVHFNKFLVFVTEEPDPDSVGLAERWAGPILLKGISRSARMQSMAGHGFFEQEPC